MEEENLEVSEEYKKWFNRGYELSKSMPEVFKGMKTPQNEPQEITQAFEAGRLQFEQENDLNRTKDRLREQYKRERSRSERGR